MNYDLSKKNRSVRLQIFFGFIQFSFIFNYKKTAILLKDLSCFIFFIFCC